MNFEIISIESVIDLPHPRQIAKERVAVYRKKKSERLAAWSTHPRMTQAMIDKCCKDREPEGTVWARIFWRHRNDL